MNNVLKSVLLVAASLLAGNAVAANFNGSASVGSDYNFRGLSQNGRDYAVSADVNVEAGGFYAGVWGSQIDGAYDMEYDLYAGYTLEASEGISLDVAYIDYNYSAYDELADFNETDLDVEEVMVAMTYKGITASYYKGLDEAADYVEVSGELAGLSFLVGELEDTGTNWAVSKSVPVFEGSSFELDASFGVGHFYADDASGLEDFKRAFVVLTKQLF